jgi:PIF1-like helicase
LNVTTNAATTRTIDGDDDEEMESFDLGDNNIRPSSSEDEQLVRLWQSTIASRKAACQDSNDDRTADPTLPSAYIEPDRNSIAPMDLDPSFVEDPLEEIAATLNKEQRKAFFLVCDHRRRNQPERANRPSQLLLYLAGAGGTGKSTVIKAICDYFDRIGKRDTLMVLAFTGIAASNISGSTLHSVCGLGFGKDGEGNDHLTGAALAQLQARWSKVEYAIIDEISVIGQKLLG